LSDDYENNKNDMDNEFDGEQMDMESLNGSDE
jgi:hypothetical protein